jgi:ABC-type transport system involved in multi-copper enzyme maturation permease subunit
MRSIAPPRPVPLQSLVAWLPARREWTQGLIGLMLLVSAVALWLVRSHLSGPSQIGLFGFLLLIAAALLGRGWSRLIGPVLFYDQLCLARRGKYLLFRSLYATALLLLLFVLYIQYENGSRVATRGTSWMANFGEAFFFAFMSAQLVVVFLLTPVWTAGAIAVEKERGTLEFLFSTELGSRDIVLGKLVSRLANLVLLLLTGLPILSLTQLWGGMDPDLVLAGFAATAISMISLAGLSMVNSVYALRARDATLVTYLVALAYLGLSLLALVVPSYPRIAALQLVSGTHPVTCGDVVDYFSSGSFIVLLAELRSAWNVGTPLAGVLPNLLGRYALFHFVVVAVCTLWAIARLRPVAVKQGYLRVETAPSRLGHWLRPRIGERPMLWKEIFAERGLTVNRFGRSVIALIILVSLLPAVWIVGLFIVDLWTTPASAPEQLLAQPWEKLGSLMNPWVRLVGTLVACLTLVGVGVRAAGSFSGERERQTLDSLLATPQQGRAILFGKWLGSILSVRWAGLWLCVVWVLGILTGGLYGFTVPWLALCWVVYASFMAAIGVWFSLNSRTTLRATLCTLLVAAGLSFGHWLPWLVGGVPTANPLYAPSGYWLVYLRKFGLTPPVALAWFAFRGSDFRLPYVSSGSGEDGWAAFVGVICGLAFWAVMTAGILGIAILQFHVVTATRNQRLPEQPVTTSRRLRPSYPLVAVALLLIVLLVGWHAYLSQTADRQLNEAIAEAERLDPGWRLDSLEARREEVSPEQNSALRVPAVERLTYMRGGWPTEALDRQLGGISPEVQLDLHQLAVLERELDLVIPALDEAYPLLDLPRGRYEIPPNNTMGYVWIRVPHLGSLSRMTLLLWCDLLYQLQVYPGDPELECCRRLLNAARSVGDEPYIFSQEARVQTVRQALQGFERALGQANVTEAALASFQRSLEEEEAYPSQLICLRSERARVDKLMQTLQDGELEWIRKHLFDGPAQARTFQIKRWLLPGYPKKERGEFLRQFTRMVEAVKLPAHEQRVALAQLERDLAEHPLTLPVEVQYQVTRLLRRIDELHAGRAELRCAIALAAIERYRLAHGRWPESLQTLVPAQLSSVAIDPYDGAPLRYRILHDGVVVYSVGPDGIDNGGNLPERDINPSSARPARSGTDIGFRLWDPAHRRQPPKSR